MGACTQEDAQVGEPGPGPTPRQGLRHDESHPCHFIVAHVCPILILESVFGMRSSKQVVSSRQISHERRIWSYSQTTVRCCGVGELGEGDRVLIRLLGARRSLCAQDKNMSRGAHLALRLNRRTYLPMPQTFFPNQFVYVATSSERQRGACRPVNLPNRPRHSGRFSRTFCKANSMQTKDLLHRWISDVVEFSRPNSSPCGFVSGLCTPAVSSVSGIL